MHTGNSEKRHLMEHQNDFRRLLSLNMDLDAVISFEKNQLQNIVVDGQNVFFSYDEDENTLCALIAWIESRFLKTMVPDGKRVLIGINGAAGTGKTFLCQLLCALINIKYGCNFSKVLSMDAYHFTNQKLIDTPWPSNNKMCLKDFKGSLETLDVASFLKDLEKLVIAASDFHTQLPVYDRNHHEPLQGQVVVGPDTKIMFIEGLHLLCKEGQWAQVQTHLHGTISLRCPLEVCRDRVVARKVRNGRSLESSISHFERVDEPIWNRIEKEHQSADLQLFFGSKPLNVREAHLQICSGAITRDELFQMNGLVQQKVLIIGLNPAFQKRLEFSGPSFRLGAVNRVSKMGCGLGGKGQNGCTAIHCLNKDMLAVTNQEHYVYEVTLANFLGGKTGSDIKEMIESLHVHCFPKWQTANPTRTCTTLLDIMSGETTEIVEPSGEISIDEQEKMLLDIKTFCCDTIGPNTLGGIIIMGSLPSNVCKTFYLRILETIMQTPCFTPAVKLLVDCTEGIRDLIAVSWPQMMLKLNAAELAKLVDISLCLQNESLSGFSFECILQNAIKCFSIYRFQYLGVTDGSHTAYLFQNPFLIVDGVSEKQKIPDIPIYYWKYHLVDIFLEPCNFRRPVLYPIGAGDTVSAVTLCFWLSGFSIPVAFKHGLAAASASCLNSQNGVFSYENLEQIAGTLKVEAVYEIYTFHEDS